MIGIHAGEQDPASRSGAGAGKRRGYDPVSRHGEVSALARRRPTDHDGVAPRAGDVRAEKRKILLQRDDLRLARRAAYRRSALGRAGGKHDVFRCADAREAQRNLRAVQLRRATEDLASLLADLRAHRTQGAQMQVDRPFSQLAASGQTQPGLAAASEQRTHKDHRRAHLRHQRVRDLRLCDSA